MTNEMLLKAQELFESEAFGKEIETCETATYAIANLVYTIGMLEAIHIPLVDFFTVLVVQAGELTDGVGIYLISNIGNFALIVRLHCKYTMNISCSLVVIAIHPLTIGSLTSEINFSHNILNFRFNFFTSLRALASRKSFKSERMCFRRRYCKCFIAP